MIRVTVDLIPYGHESEVETIGVLTIINDNTGPGAFGNYSYVMEHYDDGHTRYGGVIPAHRRSRPVWDLIQKALMRANMDSRFHG